MDSPKGWKWTVAQKWTVLSQTGRSFAPKGTVRDDTFSFLERPLSSYKFYASSFIHFGRPVFDMWPYTFSRLSRPVKTPWTVHFDLRPSTLDLFTGYFQNYRLFIVIAPFSPCIITISVDQVLYFIRWCSSFVNSGPPIESFPLFMFTCLE